MKIIGAVLIVASGLLCGQTWVKAEKRHIAALKSFLAALKIVSAELSAKLASMPELIRAAGKTEGEAGCFFLLLGEKIKKLGESSFDDIWNEALETAQGLDSGEKEQLAELGEYMGRYAAEEQLTAIAKCASALEERLCTAQESYPNLHKLRMCISVSAGILLVLLLI